MSCPRASCRDCALWRRRPRLTRFDSGAFSVDTFQAGDAFDGGQPVDGSQADGGQAFDGAQTGPLLEPVIHGRIGSDPGDDTPPRKATNQTADLLEALRRRRGERDPMDPEHEEPIAAHPSTGAVKLIEVPLDQTGQLPVVSKGTPSAGIHRYRSAGHPPRQPEESHLDAELGVDRLRRTHRRGLTRWPSSREAA